MEKKFFTRAEDTIQKSRMEIKQRLNLEVINSWSSQRTIPMIRKEEKKSLKSSNSGTGLKLKMN